MNHCSALYATMNSAAPGSNAPGSDVSRGIVIETTNQVTNETARIAAQLVTKTAAPPTSRRRVKTPPTTYEANRMPVITRMFMTAGFDLRTGSCHAEPDDDASTRASPRPAHRVRTSPLRNSGTDDHQSTLSRLAAMSPVVTDDSR